MSIRTLVNPNAREALDGPYPDRRPQQFHRRLPGYEETPLVDAPKLAGALGVGKVFVKDESNRLGLPAFKVLGASWAVYRALEERLGDEGFGDWEEIGELEERLEPLRPLYLVAATDGKHVWGAVGVSENIIEASWQALVDGLEYGVIGTKKA